MCISELIMATIQIEVPDDAFSALRQSPREFAREMRFAAAVFWYQKGIISQEKAAAIAGLDRTDFLFALTAEKINVFTVDMDDLRQELDV